jgi:hypothetical protein|tara:strand:+ start:124 stop:468 length:345 start_codon:yes stop_codon:yes gene_type:complete
MKVFNEIYEVEIPLKQNAEIKDMQSVVNKIQKALDKGTGGYYNDSLVEIEMICREIIGEFWYNNEGDYEDEIIPRYSDEISDENDKLISVLNEQLVNIRKMVKIEILMDKINNN